MNTQKKLTRTTKELIENAIKSTKSIDRLKLCESIAFTAEEKYEGLNLEFQLERMNLSTTCKILDAIDTYFHIYFKPNKFSFLNEKAI